MDRSNFIIQFIQNGGWIIFLVVLLRLLKSNKASKTDEDNVEKKKGKEKMVELNLNISYYKFLVILITKIKIKLLQTNYLQPSFLLYNFLIKSKINN